MKTNYYQRTTLHKDGSYRIEEVKETCFELKILTGQALITHVGGNGRFIFLLDRIAYTSEFTKNVCTLYTPGELVSDSTREYFDYSGVTFNINIEEEWSKLYIYNEDKVNYWKNILTDEQSCELQDSMRYEDSLNALENQSLEQ